jgi:hypothetical protein
MAGGGLAPPKKWLKSTGAAENGQRSASRSSLGLEKFLAREGLGLRLELFGVDEAEKSSMPRGLYFTTIVACQPLGKVSRAADVTLPVFFAAQDVNEPRHE